MHITQAPPPRCCDVQCKQCDLAIGTGKNWYFGFQIIKKCYIL